jgi:hypothetical protein
LFLKQYNNPSWLRSRSIAFTVAIYLGSLASINPATDGKRQLRYLVGAVAIGDYDRRIELGAEAFHQNLDRMFF